MADVPETPGPEDRDPAGKGVSGPGPTPLFSALALRVFSFFLSALLIISFGASSLVWLAQWLDVGVVDPEAVHRVFRGGQDVDPVLGLWLRAGTVPLVLWITWLFVVRFDGNRLREIGLCRPRDPGIEALLGSLAAALTLMAWLMGIAPVVSSRIEDWSSDELVVSAYLPLGAWGLLRLALLFLVIALQDEVIFRGYLFSTFRERLSWVHAAGLSNVLAVGLYAGHPDVGAAGLLNVFLLGFILAAMREKTGSLWMSTLFAAVWNVILGCVLSLPISGVLYPRLFDHRLEGSEGLTGGAYGPEASWVLTGLLLVLVAFLAAWAERRRTWAEAPDPGASEDPDAPEKNDG